MLNVADIQKPGFSEFNEYTYYCPKRVLFKLKDLEDSVAKDVRRCGGHSDPKNEGKEAIITYHKTLQNGLRPNRCTLVAALKACINLRDLETGIKIHHHMNYTGDDRNITVATTLVHMYAKCESIMQARQVFDNMPQHNVVSWNILIFGYVESGDGESALQLFYWMQEKGFSANPRTYVAGLKACATCAAKDGSRLVKVQSLEKVMAIHSQLAKKGYDCNVFVASTIVDVYAKCRSMEHTHWFFDNMTHHDLVSWTAIIFGYAESGKSELALCLFIRMQDEDFIPNNRTYVVALKACASCAAKEDWKEVDKKRVKSDSLEKGISICSQLVKNGHEVDIFVASTMVDMYVKCGSMEHAYQVFDNMPHHNLVSWTAIIFGHIETGESDLALQLFSKMQDEGFMPNDLTYLLALKACGNYAANEGGKQGGHKLVKVKSLEKVVSIHSQFVKCGYHANIFLGNTVVDLYAKCGRMEHAYWAFYKMPQHDLVSWNILMFGYAESGKSEFTLEIFDKMQDYEGLLPDARTYIVAFKACAICAAKDDGCHVEGKLVKVQSLEKVMSIHSQVAKGEYQSNVFVGNAILDSYAKCGSMEHARQAFQGMSHHDMVSWNTVIFGFVENGENECALQFFYRMQEGGFTPNARTYVVALKACATFAAKEDSKQAEGNLVKVQSLEKVMAIHSQLANNGYENDIFVASTMVDVYAKCRSMEHAHRVFNKMPHYDLVSWNALIFGYVEGDENSLALELFDRMQEQGFFPDALTFVAVLKACGSLVALDAGKKIHFQICSAGLQNEPAVAACLIGFYGKCGSMTDAEQVFDSISAKDVVIWDALLAGYAHHGAAERVFYLFKRMLEESYHLDGITFLSILNACSHAGLVDRGKGYFWLMCMCFIINPNAEHYVCMVDLHGRRNHLDDAVIVAKNMPFEPDVAMWRTILSACRNWKNVMFGRIVFQFLVRLDNKDSSAYVLMSNIYAVSGMWEESAKTLVMGIEARA